MGRTPSKWWDSHGAHLCDRCHRHSNMVQGALLRHAAVEFSRKVALPDTLSRVVGRLVVGLSIKEIQAQTESATHVKIKKASGQHILLAAHYHEGHKSVVGFLFGKKRKGVGVGFQPCMGPAWLTQWYKDNPRLRYRGEGGGAWMALAPERGRRKGKG